MGVYAWLAPISGQRTDHDWTHLWLAGRMIVTGNAASLYDPVRQFEVYKDSDPDGADPPAWGERMRAIGCFNYPPPAALCYAPLALLPMRIGAVVHAYAMLVMASGVIGWLWPRIMTHVPASLAVLALLVYPAFFINLSLGQNAVVTTTVLAGVWACANQRRDFSAGLLLGLLVCKPQWLLAVGWIPLCYGRWRVLAGTAASSLAVLAVSAAFFGLQPFHDYVNVFRTVAVMHDLPDYNLHIQYNALSLFRKWLGTGAAATALGLASSAAVVAVTAWITRGCWRPGRVVFAQAMACALTAALWINPHLNHYDLVLLPLCLAPAAADWRNLNLPRRIALITLIALQYAAMPIDLARDTALTSDASTSDASTWDTHNLAHLTWDTQDLTWDDLTWDTHNLRDLPRKLHTLIPLPSCALLLAWLWLAASILRHHHHAPFKLKQEWPETT